MIHPTFRWNPGYRLFNQIQLTVYHLYVTWIKFIKYLEQTFFFVLCHFRTNNTNVLRKLVQNLGPAHLQIQPVGTKQKLVHLPKCTTKPGEGTLILHKVRPHLRPQPRLQPLASLDLRL